MSNKYSTRTHLTTNNWQGEHGVGLGKKAFLEEELGRPAVQVMRIIKHGLDPMWLMNPGKIFDPK
jgi:D-lactate dehydrogenase (cytochrome)